MYPALNVPYSIYALLKACPGGNVPTWLLETYPKLSVPNLYRNQLEVCSTWNVSCTNRALLETFPARNTPYLIRALHKKCRVWIKSDKNHALVETYPTRNMLTQNETYTKRAQFERIQLKICPTRTCPTWYVPYSKHTLHEMYPARSVPFSICALLEVCLTQTWPIQNVLYLNCALSELIAKN